MSAEQTVNDVANARKRRYIIAMDSRVVHLLIERKDEHGTNKTTTTRTRLIQRLLIELKVGTLMQHHGIDSTDIRI